MTMLRLVIALALAGALLAPASADDGRPGDVACVIAIATPQGMICVKPDGNVDVPAGVRLDRLSRQFWEEVGRTMRLIRVGECI